MISKPGEDGGGGGGGGGGGEEALSMSLRYLCREAWNMYQPDVLSVSVQVHRLTLVDQFRLENCLLWFNRSVQ